MPPILFPQLAKLALGAFGAAAAVHWVVKEVRRINAELDRVQPAPVGDSVSREGLQTLRRDPRTGDYRVM
jgi:putative component of toxin-antitoxin plasmid stabilization module